jgi:uncharacterized membrane protein
MSNHYNKEKVRFQIERLSFFSDAVIAIALTLLIIEIKAPHIGEGYNLNQQLNQLQALYPEFISFIISFAIIISQWIKHHELFGNLINYDKKLVTLNSCFLFSIAIIPFSTSYFAHNSVATFYLPTVVYAISLMFVTSLNFLIFRHIVNNKNNLFDKSYNREHIKWMTADYLLLPAGIFISLLIGYININYGLLAYVIIMQAAFFINKQKKKSALKNA